MSKYKPEQFPQVPGRVEAALRYIAHCKEITNPFTFCEFVNRGRELTKGELSAYDAALHTVRLYFLGEVDFGGAPMHTPADAAREDDEKDKSKRKRRGEEDA